MSNNITIEAYTRKKHLSHFKLSPNGKHLPKASGQMDKVLIVSLEI